MSINRRAARKDTGATDIVTALRAAGVKVWILSGEGIPDLLTLYRGVWLPVEIKKGAAMDALDKRNGKVYRSAAGKLTDAQEKFVAAALQSGAKVPVAASPAEAVAAVLGGAGPVARCICGAVGPPFQHAANCTDPWKTAPVAPLRDFVTCELNSSPHDRDSHGRDWPCGPTAKVCPGRDPKAAAPCRACAREWNTRQGVPEQEHDASARDCRLWREDKCAATECVKPEHDGAHRDVSGRHFAGGNHG